MLGVAYSKALNRQRSLLMGLTGGIWALAGGIGPVLGGVFATLVSWRWCFYINLPVIGLAAILILLFLDIKHEHTSFKHGIQAIDWLGVLTFLGFTSMLLLGLDFGGSIFPWNSAKVVALLVVGGLMIFAFVYSEVRVSKYPLIPMELFKNKSNVATFLVTFFHGFVSLRLCCSHVGRVLTASCRCSLVLSIICRVRSTWPHYPFRAR
jgi:MFS family permease